MNLLTSQWERYEIEQFLNIGQGKCSLVEFEGARRGIMDLMTPSLYPACDLTQEVKPNHQHMMTPDVHQNLMC